MQSKYNTLNCCLPIKVKVGRSGHIYKADAKNKEVGTSEYGVFY